VKSTIKTKAFILIIYQYRRREQPHKASDRVTKTIEIRFEGHLILPNRDSSPEDIFPGGDDFSRQSNIFYRSLVDNLYRNDKLEHKN
jgi:hypothetical protein